MSDVAQQHAIQHQIQALRLGAVYGALAFAGLIATHLVIRTDHSAFGALLAITGALFAYLNFTAVSIDAESPWIGRLQLLSIGAGLLSGLLVLAGAL